MSKRVVIKAAKGRDRRRKGIRKKLSGTAGRPRLSVFRGNSAMNVQLVDDVKGVTIASASTLEKQFRERGKMTKTKAAASLGEIIAKRAAEKGVNTVVFDRGGYKYHGRVKALADAARENGLIF
ncbi:MAG: 50S ribosomal protein L18 [Candidatus Geothermincolia bacterium]